MMLLELPNEILARIVGFLDSPSPFDDRALDKPQLYEHKTGFSIQPSQILPTHVSLKHLSASCLLFRSISLPVLFKHVTINPLHLSDFLSFLSKNQLNQRVTSVVAIVIGHYNHIHPAWWARLLNDVPATRFSIIGAPQIFSEMAGTSSWSTDEWAFNMKSQILSLDQSMDAARCRIDYDNLPNILTARPWTRMLVNEGSSVLAYTTYEYFFRKTPSVLSALHFNNPEIGEQVFANLQEFEFVAIFPFYNHVEEVLKCVRKMTNLQKLSIQICPTPDSTVLHDEIEAAGGHLDVNDPWNECDTSWRLIAYNVAALSSGGNLRELHMHDVRLDGVKTTLEDSLNTVLKQSWIYQGQGSGIWRTRIPADKGGDVIG